MVLRNRVPDQTQHSSTRQSSSSRVVHRDYRIWKSKWLWRWWYFFFIFTMLFVLLAKQYNTNNSRHESILNNGTFAANNSDTWNHIQQKLCPNYKPRSIWFRNTLFGLAARELGITNPSDVKGPPNFFHGFFSHPEIYRVDKTSSLTYVPIWKCGNKQIRHLLNTNFDEGGDSSREKGKKDCRVTVIRDPISHFLSAYNEIEFRLNLGTRSPPSGLVPDNDGFVHDKKDEIPYTKKKIGSTQRFSQFVVDLLSKKTSHKMSNYNYSHLYSMSRVLIGFKLNAYIPTLHNITHNFFPFLRKNCPGFPEIKTLPSPPSIIIDHPSSSDPLHTYKAAKDIWKEQGPTARALCVLHAMDYACWRDLPDGVPELCRDVYSDPSFVKAILFDKIHDLS